eukprot:10127257-Alexandrium_andersonii.AAC.1
MAVRSAVRSRTLERNLLSNGRSRTLALAFPCNTTTPTDRMARSPQRTNHLWGCHSQASCRT